MKFVKNYIVLCFTVLIVASFTNVLWAEKSAQNEKININTATIEELTQLKRIGTKYAKRIVEYREKEGPFRNAEDVMNVQGIGPKNFEANKDRIIVSIPQTEEGK
ncbi:helix-hairpin-helix domain-containing protein [bacterium]|nr:helix-hairpin-helix domain-containing protein [bacterium]